MALLDAIKKLFGAKKEEAPVNDEVVVEQKEEVEVSSPEENMEENSTEEKEY